jgi:hypothetical protein
MKKKNQILSLWGKTNPKTGKPWSKLGISKKVKVSRTYVYQIIEKKNETVSTTPKLS